MAADVVVKFLADTTQLTRGLNEVEGAGRKMSGFAKGIVASIGSAALAAGIYKSVQAASSLNETISQSEQVFGKSARAINEWAEGAADDFGQSRQQALEAASGFGNLFDQLGIGSQRAATMSKTMVELASDFASFKDADVSQVLEAQSSAFRGEYDAMQRFVPTLSAATVETEALKETGKENAAALTAQEKATATYKLMIEGAGKALGDYDRTADSAANRQRALQAKLADLSATVGQALLPAFTQLLGIVSSVADVFAGLPAPVQTAVVALALFAATSGILWSAGINVVKVGGAIAKVIGQIGAQAIFATAALDTMSVATIGATAGLALLAAGVAYLALTVDDGMVVNFAAAETAAKKWTGTLVAASQASGDSAAFLKDQLRLLNAEIRMKAEAEDVDLDTMVKLALKQKELEGAHAAAVQSTREAKAAEAERKLGLDMLAAATTGVATATETTRKEVTNLANAYLAVQGGEVGYQAAQLQVEAAELRLSEVLKDHTADSLEARQATNDLESARISAATSAYNLQKSQGDLNEAIKGGQSGLIAYRDSLTHTIETQGDQTGATQLQIDKVNGFLFQMALADGATANATLTVDDSAARETIRNFTRDLLNLSHMTMGTGSFAPPGFETGGVVPGPVGAPMLAVVHGGETVIPVGGSVTTRAGGLVQITVNVAPTASPADTGAAVVDAIRSYERANGTAWRN